MVAFFTLLCAFDTYNSNGPCTGVLDGNNNGEHSDGGGTCNTYSGFGHSADGCVDSCSEVQGDDGVSKHTRAEVPVARILLTITWGTFTEWGQLIDHDGWKSLTNVEAIIIV